MKKLGPRCRQLVWFERKLCCVSLASTTKLSSVSRGKKQTFSRFKTSILLRLNASSNWLDLSSEVICKLFTKRVSWSLWIVSKVRINQITNAENKTLLFLLLLIILAKHSFLEFRTAELYMLSCSRCLSVSCWVYCFCLLLCQHWNFIIHNRWYLKSHCC